LRVLAESLVPRVRSICFQVYRSGQSKKVKYVLNHCSSNLENLTLLIDIPKGDGSYDWEQELEEPRSWENLKQLNLWYCCDKSDSKAFWPWLWKRCGRVEMLTMGMIKDIVNSLGEGMVSMSNLNQIQVGQKNYVIPFEITDDELAMVLSGARKGWKTLTLGGAAKVGGASMAYLSRHLSTLETLVMGRHDDAMNTHLMLMIARCPALCTLAFADEHGLWRSNYSGFKAETFIDRDPCTGALKPWLCEASLQRLTFHISGIPRPDLLDNMAIHETVVEETYPGQGREIQSQVYDRIARFTNLKLLRLDDTGLSMGFGCRTSGIYSDCLEMSLESGLQKLAKLKALRVLDVSGMRTRIDVKEAQWMVQHWPDLRYVGGLQGSGTSMRALKWFQENCPQITVADRSVCFSKNIS
jgi:hypothetical protein